jgi:hypothetical protein
LSTKNEQMSLKKYTKQEDKNVDNWIFHRDYFDASLPLSIQKDLAKRIQRSVKMPVEDIRSLNPIIEFKIKAMVESYAKARERSRIYQNKLKKGRAAAQESDSESSEPESESSESESDEDPCPPTPLKKGRASRQIATPTKERGSWPPTPHEVEEEENHHELSELLSGLKHRSAAEEEYDDLSSILSGIRSRR